MWTCLEVILWEQFQSLLSGYQQSRLEHQTRISSGSPFWLANTKHESIAVAQSRRSCEALPNWHGSIEAARISCNTMRSSLVSYSLWSHHKQRSATWCKANQYKSTISEDQQDRANWTNARASSHWLWSHIYILPKHHVPFLMCLFQQNIPSLVCFIKTPFHLSATAQHHMV